MTLKKGIGLFSVLTLLLIASCNQKENNKSATTQKQAGIDSSFSIKTACLLSEISYCTDPQKEIEQYLPGWKLAWNPIAINGNYAFVATDGTTYAIAIRGSLLQFNSAAFSNWIYNDLNVVDQKDWTYTNDKRSAKISEGAYEGFENMNKLVDKTTGKNLWDFLNENVKDNSSLLVTGHSLGGNLATVYASYLSWKWKDSGHPKNNINVITFAAPAAGNGSFADDFNSKFPNSSRVENVNDIVPKFPVSGRIADLGNLYSPSPAASEIQVGYKDMTVSLNKVFTLIGGALDLMKLTNDLSSYAQTNGDGTLITGKYSGKNTTNTATDWFAEAGFQHGMAQYATTLNVPVITCDQ